MSHSEIFTKSLFCWDFSGQKESKPDRCPKTFNQEAKAAFTAPSRSVLFPPLTSHTQISAGSQLHKCKSAQKRFVCFQQILRTVLPGLMQLSCWQHVITHFPAGKIFSQTIDFFFFPCANVFK